MSDQAARKRAKRASQVRAEDDAKEFAARLKQRLEQKPPRVGKAKARYAALAKKSARTIAVSDEAKAAINREAGPSNGPLK